ncbi:MAG: energy-coupling factor transporter ATPase [Anaerolineae bacterium]|nr:energy-coupling factor transporter ATPase [Candidatus Roseilinea sp.]MDW8450988.1 energy-coupling factor transporter ATPase [Anaerolineae bacterium]
MAINITGLSYTYANRAAPALRDVTLDFRPGEVTLVVGRSGSGKTTLIRCINGLIPHSYKNGTLHGEIRCFDQSTAGLSLAQLARRVGTVMQDPDKQIVASRVLNEIAFGLENIGLPRERIVARVHEVARQLRIEHLLDRDTHTLSGGEQQKVVIAATLAMQPRALLLDEPLASLDLPSARTALALFRRLADEGIAVVLVEHRVAEALRVAPERCVALHDGSVAFDGDTAGFRAWLDARHKTQDDGASPVSRPASSVNSASLLSFYDVHFAYPGASGEQLGGVSFDVREGDVIALMGPNGAGKSTLCKMAIGLLRPARGRVIVAGEDAARLTVAQLARKVGYVFQNPAAMLFANTLREELSFGPRNVGMPEDRMREAIADALETVGLSHLSLDQSPFGLSFGQQKRVAVAGVLAMQPRVLILDEPTAGLDDGAAEDLLCRLLRAARGPQAIVMVTHDLALARRFANRVVLMAGGRIVADGPPRDTLENDEAMRRAGLIAAEPLASG